MITRKTEGVIALAAAFLVIAVNWLDPAISFVVALVALGGLGVYDLKQKN